MGEGNSTLVTIVILVIAVLIILWIFTSLDSGPCVGPRPDPVGGITSSTEEDGRIVISWDPSENASKYKLYINIPPVVTGGRKNVTSKTVFTSDKKHRVGKHKVGSCGADCCPSDASACTACVSQTNYKEIIETDDTSIIIETCEPRLCYMIVPYNSCGQAGPCNEINYVDVQCTVSSVNAWLSKNDCSGTTIEWDVPRCADTIIILVNNQEITRVAATDGRATIDQVPDGYEISVQAVSSCGTGSEVVVRPAVTGGNKTGPSKVEDWKRAQSKVGAAKPRRRQPHPRGQQNVTRVTIKDYKIGSSDVKVHTI